jgi:hypothetical protein
MKLLALEPELYHLHRPVVLSQCLSCGCVLWTSVLIVLPGN